MKPINALFNEVKLEMLKVALIYSFLDSIMVFFIVYFVVSFFNIKFLFTILIPGVITFIFFVVNFITRINRLRLKTMEEANPQIKEMLRTAHDNMNDENLMMMALFEELKGKMRTVSSGNLLESKRIITRIISAVIIVFLIIFVSTFNVNLKKIDIPFEKLRFMTGNNNAELGEGELTGLVFNETDVVYGDASIAKLGNEKLDLNMNPTMSEIDFNKIGDAEKQDLREGEVPSEVGVNPDAFNNQQVLDEAEQAANYSQRIKNI
jgi:uncharacterized membrane protein (DUF106 family)